MVRDLRQQATLVALLRERPGGAPWSEITAAVLETGSATQAWSMLAPQILFPVPAMDDLVDAALADVTSWTQRGLAIVTVLDDDYPARLREVHQAPPLLFVRGRLVPHDRAVAVVGSRKASACGRAVAGDIARALVRDGLTVLSGLAEGIDTAAHVAALESGGRTVAVLGTGADRYFPASNTSLQQSIAARGMVLSQFWPDAPPTRQTFPMRNATMSGYGLATVVVEAGEQSGSRIQARVAVEHARPVILTDRVVEGNEWARRLAQTPGVHVATGIGEIMGILHDLDQHRSSVAEKVRTLLPT